MLSNFGAPRRQSLGLRLLRGAAAGFLLGSSFVALGLLRFCAGGGTPEQGSGELARDFRVFAFYVGGFAIAGALADAVQPLLPGKTGTFARFGVGGAIVAMMIALGDTRRSATLDGAEWVVILILGALIGCAFAYGFTRAN